MFVTRTTGTVHTSDKAQLTSVTTQIHIRGLDCHHNLIIRSLAHCQSSLIILCKSVQKFSCKIANRQTNNNDYISSLAEVTKSCNIQYAMCATQEDKQLECGPMPNVMAALPNIGGALCSTPQSLANAHY